MDAVRSFCALRSARSKLIGNDGDADLGTTNGNVTVSDIHGTLTIRDRFGAVSASNIERAATITSSNGSVRLHHAASANVTNSFGAVEVGDITGDLMVRNQNGSLDVTNVSGTADIGTSFDRITFLNIKQKLLCNRRMVPSPAAELAAAQPSTPVSEEWMYTISAAHSKLWTRTPKSSRAIFAPAQT